MRVALWIALLLAVFALAWLLQDDWLAARRAEQDEAFGRPGAPAGELPPGVSRVVVGAPSGAEPLHGAEPAPRPQPESGTAPQPAPPVVRQHVVLRGETLSQICASVYGTARPDVVGELARHNGLARPDAIREGQTLVLPPLAELRARPR